MAKKKSFHSSPRDRFCEVFDGAMENISVCEWLTFLGLAADRPNAHQAGNFALFGRQFIKLLHSRSADEHPNDP
jgi:hypothetical protein